MQHSNHGGKSWSIQWYHKKHVISLLRRRAMRWLSWAFRRKLISLYDVDGLVQKKCHDSDIMVNTMASPITSVLIVCLTVCSSPDQRKYQSSASLAFVRGIHRWLVNSPHKGPVRWKIFPFDDVIMQFECISNITNVLPRNPWIFNSVWSSDTIWWQRSWLKHIKAAILFAWLLGVAFFHIWIIVV